jgi:hypothetical protein
LNDGDSPTNLPADGDGGSSSEDDTDDDDSSSPSPSVVPDFSKLKLPELKVECKKRGLKISGSKKVVVLRLLEYEEGGGGEDSANDNFASLNVTELKAECKKRGLPISGRKATLLTRLREDSQLAKDDERLASILQGLSKEERLVYEMWEERFYEIDRRKKDLLEYRSHLVRHHAEDLNAAKGLEELADDEAIVTSDYKMKILACYFRENQKKWFGKRGTSLLGFMITRNPNSDDNAETENNNNDKNSNDEGYKKVTFVMLLTDDTLQDDWEVACGKNIIYSKYLPAHITKVHFVSDGAGCFKSQLHRIIQPFWKIWTGVHEVSFRLTPAGDGKSALDGMFGRLNTVLRGAVTEGASYCNSETIGDAITKSNGLASTQFVIFKPKRQQQLTGQLRGIDMQSVLLTTLDPDQSSDNPVLLAYQHSGYGPGFRIELASAGALAWVKVNGRKKQKIQDVDPYNSEVRLIEFLCCCLFYFILSHFVQGVLKEAAVMLLEPLCSLFDQAENRRGFLTTKLAKAGTGAGLKSVRQKKQRRRLDTKVDARQEDMEAERAKMRKAGLFVCDAREERTGRCCRCICLDRRRYDIHGGGGKHDFPVGESARDFFLRQASRPGGLVAAGGRVDRQSKILTGDIVAAEPGVGELEARCYQAFNRKEVVRGKRKTKTHTKMLVNLYNRRPKLTSTEMREEMRRMRAPDGGLLFSYRRRNSTGELLTVDQIQSWITIRSAKGKDNQEPTESDIEEQELVNALDIE